MTFFQPDWRQEPPEEGSYRSIFKWGAKNEFKSPNMNLYNLLKERLNLTDSDFAKKWTDGSAQVKVDKAITLTDDIINKIREMIGPENVLADDYSRVKYSCGKSTEEVLALREGLPIPLIDLALKPRNRDDVAKIIGFCGDKKIPVHVYGGGSSVTLGLTPTKPEITLIMTAHMNKFLELNEIDQTATVESGIMGPDYEYALNNAKTQFKTSRNFTCGHFPQSFQYSTVGGWIVTLGSGQQSSYYGDIYDIVLRQEYITPQGDLKTLDFPGTATGPKLNDIMKGSEGCFGVLVSAKLKIFRLNSNGSQRFAFIFPDWESTVNAAREISQGEFGSPSVFRISDPEETDVALKLYGVDNPLIDKLISFRGYKQDKRCLFIGQADGERRFARNIKSRVKEICRHNGAMSLTGLPVRHWEHGRYRDPYLREALNDFGIVIDTLETGLRWSQLHDIYQGVRDYIKKRPNTICMAHCSHFYPQGTNLYFIFITKYKNIDDYKGFQTGIIDRIISLGGSLSHHHGVGKLFAPWAPDHLGRINMDTLRLLKNYFDPNNIMNRGVIFGMDSTNCSKE